MLAPTQRAGRTAGRRALLAMLGVAAAGALGLAATIVEDFSGMPTGVCYPDGSSAGAWQFVYHGYGCTAFVAFGPNTMLVERPRAAVSWDETHAGLVLGPSISGDLSLAVSTATTRQLRVNSAPNPWEVAWVAWHYADNLHFYYFIAKPNGWEIGKADPAYPGAQRFLATGSTPTFPIGAWYRIQIVQTAATIRVSVDDRLLATVIDTERPYTAGRIGLYTEDAEVYFDDVALTSGSKPGKGKKGR